MPETGGEDTRGRYRGTITDPFLVSKLKLVGAIEAEIEHLILRRAELHTEFWQSVSKKLGLPDDGKHTAKFSNDFNEIDVFAKED